MNYRFPPMQHQENFLKVFGHKRAAGELFDMGTGKSKTLIDNAAHLFLAGHIQGLVVIGNDGSFLTWASEHIPIHMPEEVHYDLQLWSSKLTGKKLHAFEEICKHSPVTDRLQIIILNIKAISCQRSYKLVETFLKTKKSLLAIDESSTIKNPKAAQTKAAFKLRDLAVVRRILTGSPIDNSPLNAWSQLEFLEKGSTGYKSFYAFKNQFADCRTLYKQVAEEKKHIGIARLNALAAQKRAYLPPAVVAQLTEIIEKFKQPGRNDQELRMLCHNFETDCSDEYLCSQVWQIVCGRIQIVDGYKNLEEFQKILRKNCMIVSTADCIDLPEKVYQKHFVTLTDEQKQVYRQIKEESFAILSAESMVTAQNVMSRILRLHQIVCGFTVDQDKTVIELPAKRYDAMLDLVEETSGKILVYANYVVNIKKICEHLSREYGPDSVVSYYGETSDKDRLAAVDAIQNGAARFFVTNSTGAYGLNLTAIRTMFAFSNIFNAEVRNQVEKRLHRIGQKFSVLYIDMLVEKTVDEVIFDNLRGKKTLSDSLLISNWREILQ